MTPTCPPLTVWHVRADRISSAGHLRLGGEGWLDAKERAKERPGDREGGAGQVAAAEPTRAVSTNGSPEGESARFLDPPSCSSDELGPQTSHARLRDVSAMNIARYWECFMYVCRILA